MQQFMNCFSAISTGKNTHNWYIIDIMRLMLHNNVDTHPAICYCLLYIKTGIRLVFLSKLNIRSLSRIRYVAGQHIDNHVVKCIFILIAAQCWSSTYKAIVGRNELWSSSDFGQPFTGCVRYICRCWVNKLLSFLSWLFERFLHTIPPVVLLGLWKISPFHYFFFGIARIW